MAEKMTENEVNEKCKEWLLVSGFKYKGVLNTKPDEAADPNGYGQVPVPDGTRDVLIDHQGVNDRERSLIWVEAKGDDCGMSDLLQGFIRVVYACYWGGGSALLAVPNEAWQRILQQQDFLRRVAVSCERRVGILDAEKGRVYWL